MPDKCPASYRADLAGILASRLAIYPDRMSVVSLRRSADPAPDKMSGTVSRWRLLSSRLAIYPDRMSVLSLKTHGSPAGVENGRSRSLLGGPSLFPTFDKNGHDAAPLLAP